MDLQPLQTAITTVPPGAWAVAVSGGADSVALLMLLRGRADLSLHVVHLDHETREGQSRADAAFVAEASARLGLTCTIARRSEIEPTMSKLPRNVSARYRAIRMELFRKTIESQQLLGVILAHHADDQAETVLQRLLRGSGPTALTGMSPRAIVSGIVVLRPLLDIDGADLRQFLREIGEPWREDCSNASPRYLRNRIRPIVAGDPALRQSLLNLADACARLKEWMSSSAPKLDEQFDAAVLAAVPPPLARHAAGRWLAERGSPVDQINRAVCERLVLMASDAATASRQHFPGGLLVHRRRGTIGVKTE